MSGAVKRLFEARIASRLGASPSAAETVTAASACDVRPTELSSATGSESAYRPRTHMLPQAFGTSRSGPEPKSPWLGGLGVPASHSHLAISVTVPQPDQFESRAEHAPTLKQPGISLQMPPSAGRQLK